MQPRVRASREARGALAEHFTVYTYDRRGRGDSGDTQPYSPAREVEDLAALVARLAGRRRCSVSRRAARCRSRPPPAALPITHVVAYEPPYVDDEGTAAERRTQVALTERVRRGDRAGAVTYFMKDMVGVPAPVVIMMRMMPWVWPKAEGRGAHAAVRRGYHDVVQHPAETLRVDSRRRCW